MKIKAIGISLILYFGIMTAFATESSLYQFRSDFQRWQNTYQTLDEAEQKKQLALLKDYSLYPYALYQYLSAHLDTVSAEEINQFVAQHRDFPLTTSLIQSYLEELTKQKAWQKIVLLNIDNSTASRCRYQYALFQLGQKEKALTPIKDIWLSGDDLPSACDPIFNEWSKTSEKSANLILLRVEEVLKKGNIKLARYLTGQLPDNYKTLKKNLFALYDNPKNLLDFSKNISPSLFSKKVIMLSFSRLVNVDADLAKKALPTLVKQQKLTESDETNLLRNIAYGYFKSVVTDEQIKWRDQFIAQDRNTSLIEKRIRLALKNNDMKDVAYWLNLLSQSDSQKDEWSYWKAMVLFENDQSSEATAILQNLIKERGFYAMYSAQKLGKAYHFDFEYPVIDNSKSLQTELTILKDKYSDDPVIKRVEELRFWGMLIEANREWRNYLYSNVDSKKYAEIARYAYVQGWGEYSVQATIAGKLWNNWVERFPVVYQDLFNESLLEKNIPLSYTLAIARQESALDATVQSPAGARGLMQLMPGTAKDSAKKIAGINYYSADQLYDPKINIQLGTYYLDHVYERFEHNRILASAAYNAGPNRVSRWLSESNDRLDAIAFIESIPFTETRNYVKSVLVYDYIYQLVLQNKPTNILTDNELSKKY